MQAAKAPSPRTSYLLDASTRFTNSTGHFFKIAVQCSDCPHCGSAVNILFLTLCLYNLQAYLSSYASSIRERKEFDPLPYAQPLQPDLDSIQNSSVGYEYAFTNTMSEVHTYC
jgi:hypothetical protein